MGGYSAVLLFLLQSPRTKVLIRQDYLAYSNGVPFTCSKFISYLHVNAPKSFRNVFYYRVANQRKILCRLLYILCKSYLRPCDGIDISGNIDGGLRITHSYVSDSKKGVVQSESPYVKL